MYRLLIITFILLPFLSCRTKEPISLSLANTKETRLINIQTKNGKASYLQIINNDKRNTALFNIAINNRGIYSMDKMVEFIRSQYTGLTPAEQVWRFVSTFSQHKKRVTNSKWHYDPLLFMNSSGGSFCGFRSAAMVNILNYMGEKARSWSLQGHVISEVYADGKWHVYDPDLGILYYNKKGEICSFEELCKNPELISTPENITCITNKCDSFIATSKEIAKFYSTQENNFLFNTAYTKRAESEFVEFKLPPKSKLSFPLNAGINEQRFALACLEIPPKWNGRIQIPLILYNVEGTASVFLSEKQIVDGKKQIEEIISSDSLFECQIKIENNSEGLKLYYYINPLIYFLETENKIEITGTHISNISTKAIPYNQDNIPDLENPCNTESYDNLYRMVSDCEKMKDYKVSSFEDYMHKVSLLNDCGAFKQLNMDSAKVFSSIDSALFNYKNLGQTFWSGFDRPDNFILSLLEIISQAPESTELRPK
jgi:hypothetical protein